MFREVLEGEQRQMIRIVTETNITCHARVLYIYLYNIDRHFNRTYVLDQVKMDLGMTEQTLQVTLEELEKANMVTFSATQEEGRCYVHFNSQNDWFKN